MTFSACRYLGYNCISVVEGLDTISCLEELHVECQQLSQGETIYFDPRTIANLAVCSVLNITFNIKLTELFLTKRSILIQNIATLINYLTNFKNLNDFHIAYLVIILLLIN